MKKSNLIVAAAVTGIIGAAINMAAPSIAMADDAKGKCLNANACKGKGDCSAADGSHACSGKNACKGKGWTKATEADCKKAADKDKKAGIKWEKA